eukprot:gene31885-41032_t
MQFIIERGALLKALGHVQNVVERRNTIPILSNVLLSAEGRSVSFSATDLDMEIVDTAEASVHVPGQITAPAHTLYEIVRKLPEGADVELKFSAGDDPRLSVSAGRSRFALPVLPAGDFPIMSNDHEGVAFSILRDDLKRLIDKTSFAVSTEETRYYLNGLYLHSLTEDGSNYLRAVATDGHRLALAEMPAPDGAMGGPGVIIPRKTIIELQRLLDDSEEPVQLDIANNQVKLTFADIELISKLVEGKFPDYTRVVPKGYKNNFTISRDQLLRSLQRVAIMTSDKFKGVRWVIAPGSLKISSTNADQEEA